MSVDSPNGKLNRLSLSFSTYCSSRSLAFVIYASDDSIFGQREFVFLRHFRHPAWQEAISNAAGSISSSATVWYATLYDANSARLFIWASHQRDWDVLFLSDAFIYLAWSCPLPTFLDTVKTPVFPTSHSEAKRYIGFVIFPQFGFIRSFFLIISVSLRLYFLPFCFLWRLRDFFFHCTSYLLRC